MQVYNRQVLISLNLGVLGTVIFLTLPLPLFLLHLLTINSLLFLKQKQLHNLNLLLSIKRGDPTGKSQVLEEFSRDLFCDKIYLPP